MSNDLNWLWPLLAGALLTASGAIWRDITTARRKRIESGREHSVAALTLSTHVASEFSVAQGFTLDPVRFWNESLQELSEISLLLPDDRVRSAVEDACYIIREAWQANYLVPWEQDAGLVQRRAIYRLRTVLGAGARGETKLPRDNIAWLRQHAAELRWGVDRSPG